MLAVVHLRDVHQPRRRLRLPLGVSLDAPLHELLDKLRQRLSRLVDVLPRDLLILVGLPVGLLAGAADAGGWRHPASAGSATGGSEAAGQGQQRRWRRAPG